MDGRRLRIAAQRLAVLALALTTLPCTVSASGDAGAPRRLTTSTAETRAPAAVVASGSRWPSSITGRKVLDQYGRVYLIRTFSSWGMASNLSKADITSA